MNNFKMPYDIFKEKLKDKNLYEINFQIAGSDKYNDCWLGYNETYNRYWFGLTPEGNNAYDFSTANEALNSPVFDGKSIYELWNKVIFYTINGLSTNEWFLCVCVKFYRCRKQDAYNVAKLACKLWQDSDFDELNADFKRIATHKNEVVFTAYIDEKMIAFAHCNIRKEYVEGTESSPVAYLEAIYVEQEYRNMGVASYLIGDCENWAKEKGCSEFASDCDIENINSRKMHESNNFKEVSKLVHYVKRLN